MVSRYGRRIPQGKNPFQYPLNIMLVGPRGRPELLEEEQYLWLLHKVKPRFPGCVRALVCTLSSFVHFHQEQLRSHCGLPFGTADMRMYVYYALHHALTSLRYSANNGVCGYPTVYRVCLPYRCFASCIQKPYGQADWSVPTGTWHEK